MEKVVFVEGMRCEHCSKRVINALETLGYEVKVDLEKGSVSVSKDEVNENEVKNAIEELGFIVK